jgi:hypothetical protein
VSPAGRHVTAQLAGIGVSDQVGAAGVQIGPVGLHDHEVVGVDSPDPLGGVPDRVQRIKSHHR